MFWDYKKNIPSVIVTNLENLHNCTGQSVADSTLKAITIHGLDPKKCSTWVTDNTAYMSSNKKEMFGKLSSSIGFSRTHNHIISYIWLGYHFSQYQLPIRSRWGYELLAAKQYLAHCKAHIEFVNRFIKELENNRNIPPAYPSDWCLFRNWLLNKKPNIQIQCLVIFEKNHQAQLPSGQRAHEIPDKVNEWLKFLDKLRKNFDTFFGQELLTALES
ncbi:13006_t:CDS:2 [Acaulospora morrowiae]|uniref:13006_t:CDS:1 n=1 Tax=Acaulospora morrowiae TaxID=94023 RepID=A0A9N8Z963_9GLOM|nr:13006_t:CDS:2 [Acaulospora morrowiae]